MAQMVCPWWLGYFLVNPIRRLRQDPATILRPFVSEGMLVLEPGSGMGFFTLDLARLVGSRGKIIAVDVQEKMLAGLRRRAAKAGLGDWIETRRASHDKLMLDDLAGRVDFALAFAVIHELPDQERFFVEMYRALRAGGKMLAAEPKMHVKLAAFESSMKLASRAGFRVLEGPPLAGSRSAVLERP